MLWGFPIRKKDRRRAALVLNSADTSAQTFRRRQLRVIVWFVGKGYCIREGIGNSPHLLFWSSGQPTDVGCELFIRSFGSISERTMVSENVLTMKMTRRQDTSICFFMACFSWKPNSLHLLTWWMHHCTALLYIACTTQCDGKLDNIFCITLLSCLIYVLYLVWDLKMESCKNYAVNSLDTASVPSRQSEWRKVLPEKNYSIYLCLFGHSGRSDSLIRDSCVVGMGSHSAPLISLVEMSDCYASGLGFNGAQILRTCCRF